MSPGRQRSRLDPCPVTCSTTATSRTSAASCSPPSRATTARFAVSRRKPRAHPTGTRSTRSGGPSTPQPQRKRSGFCPSTSPSAPPQPPSATSRSRDRPGPPPTRRRSHERRAHTRHLERTRGPRERRPRDLPALEKSADQLKVAVADARLDEKFEFDVANADGLAAFYHPFAYAADRGLGFGCAIRNSLDLQPQN